MHERSAERKELKRLLLNGASIQMFAPRRIGKTWLIHALAGDLRNDWVTIVLDVEGMRTEDEFLRALCRKLEETDEYAVGLTAHLKHRLKQLFAEGFDGNPLHAIGKIDHKLFSDALIASLNAQAPKSLILIDEIALFLEQLIRADPAAARAFLYHLRRLRQAYPKVRWLLTGSIGLDVVARRAGLQGALVDLKIFPLEPFDNAAARSYLAHLSDNGEVPKPFSLDDEAFAHLAKELGWLAPFYLQTIADRITPTGPSSRGRPSATLDDIERAFEDLLRPEFRTHFSPFEEHIEKNFPEPEERQLRAILDICCERAEGETVSTLLGAGVTTSARDANDLLTALSTAGYLTLDGERWRFRSGLLRRYWLRYHHG